MSQRFTILALFVVAILLAACATPTPTAVPPTAVPATKAPEPTKAAATVAPTVAPTAVPATKAPEPTKPPEPTKAAAPDKVTVAYVAITNFAPLYIAIERGYMKEQNIEVSAQKVTTAADALPFLATGQYDAGGIGMAAATFNGFNKALDFRIVASAAIQPLKNGPTVILVRKDLKDSGKVKSVADLKGMKVGVAGAAGSTGAYFVAKALRDVNLTFKDITAVNLANPDLVLAMKQSSVDAALVGPPYSDQILKDGTGVLLAQDTAPGAMTTVWMYSGKFIKERPDVARRFMLALVKGSRAMQGAKYLDPENIKAYIKYTPSTEDAIKTGIPPFIDPDLKVYLDSVKSLEEVFRAEGWTDYTNVIAADKMADTSFVDNAVKVLGAFKP
ncbi:MAG: ABC transporter substrate-binding protein [Chloroflexi bacterium]|nr:ABC transporter substrate-binding protein [Chloroflexota bacterium]